MTVISETQPRVVKKPSHVLTVESCLGDTSGGKTYLLSRSVNTD
jgi:hypothetical protein